MSDRDELAQMQRAAERLVPALAERLQRHALGEIEVRSGELRVRVAGGSPAPVPAKRVLGHEAVAPAGTPHLLPSPEAPTPGPGSVLAPAVGYFVFGDGLGPGLIVQRGDALGFVDVLGVRHDVRAPVDGTVRNLVTETGEAVEYGQTLLELEVAAR
ncbi:MAG TPA: biotin/lipoyl-containing protein [Candidatus Limnocylindria bacterium]|nr:biotin/lipoyl-containing protein [Candidatus Limnocylindria bacterium]